MTEPSQTSTALLDQLLEWQRKIDALPPVPRYIMAHHAVPYGSAYRQWTTRGELLVWVNRGRIADLPRALPAPVGGLELPFGIPVVNA